MKILVVFNTVIFILTLHLQLLQQQYLEMVEKVKLVVAAIELVVAFVVR